MIEKNKLFEKYESMYSVPYYDSKGRTHKLYEDGTDELIEGEINSNSSVGLQLAGHRFVSGPGFDLMQQEEEKYLILKYGNNYLDEVTNNNYVKNIEKMLLNNFERRWPNDNYTKERAIEKINEYRKFKQKYSVQNLIDLKHTDKISSVELLAICLQIKGVNASVNEIESVLSNKKYRDLYDVGKTRDLLLIDGVETKINNKMDLREVYKELSKNPDLKNILNSEEFKNGLKMAQEIEDSMIKSMRKYDTNIPPEPIPAYSYPTKDINDPPEPPKSKLKFKHSYIFTLSEMDKIDNNVKTQNEYLIKNGIDMLVGDKFTFKKNGKAISYTLKGLNFDLDTNKVYAKAIKKDPVLNVDVECTFKLDTLKEILKNSKNEPNKNKETVAKNKQQLKMKTFR